MDRWSSLWGQVCGLPPHPDVPGSQRFLYGSLNVGGYFINSAFPLGQVACLCPWELAGPNSPHRSGALPCVHWAFRHGRPSYHTPSSSYRRLPLCAQVQQGSGTLAKGLCLLGRWSLRMAHSLWLREMTYTHWMRSFPRESSLDW